MTETLRSAQGDGLGWYSDPPQRHFAPSRVILCLARQTVSLVILSRRRRIPALTPSPSPTKEKEATLPLRSAQGQVDRGEHRLNNPSQGLPLHLFCQFLGFYWVDLEAESHRAGKGDFLQVATFRSGGLRF